MILLSHIMNKKADIEFWKFYITTLIDTFKFFVTTFFLLLGFVGLNLNNLEISTLNMFRVLIGIFLCHKLFAPSFWLLVLHCSH